MEQDYLQSDGQNDKWDELEEIEATDVDPNAIRRDREDKGTYKGAFRNKLFEKILENKRSNLKENKDDLQA